MERREIKGNGRERREGREMELRVRKGNERRGKE